MAISSGELVTLHELNPSLPSFKEGASFRVTGKWVSTLPNFIYLFVFFPEFLPDPR